MSSTTSILKGKYPAKDHARRVGEYIQAAGHTKEGVIYLESQKTSLIEDNDEPVPFRYEYSPRSKQALGVISQCFTLVLPFLS